MPSFKKKFKELDRAYKNTLGSVEERLLLSYRTTLDEVQNKIAKVFADFGDKPSITEVRKYNRLKNIEKEITQNIAELNNEVNNVISSTVKTTAVNSFSSTVNGINQAMEYSFVPITINKEGLTTFLSDTLWSDALKNSNAELLTSTKREFETILRANAREEVVSGVAQGKSYRDIAKSIKERFDVSATRAKTIAFTETHKAHSYGRNEGVNNAMLAAERLGMTGFKVWRHNAVGKPRPSHVAADGQHADKDGLFHVGGEAMEAPGLGTDPGNNINCFPGSVFVSSPTRIEGATKRLYIGELITIKTNSGIELTGTPNHPILTPTGWIGLNFLNKGDDVFNANIGNSVFDATPDIYNSPSKIGEIFNFLSIVFRTKRRAGVEMDFHGDGISDSEVNIISTDSFLGNGCDSVKSKFLSNIKLPFADLRKSALFCNGFFNDFVFRCGVFLSCFMSVLGKLPFFLFTHFRHSFNECQFTTSDRDIVFSKHPPDGTSTIPDRLTNRKEGFPFDISFDKIVSVVKENFIEGLHVYNLQTEKKYYLVKNNITNSRDNNKYLIAHNCHCSVEFEIDESSL